MQTIRFEEKPGRFRTGNTAEYFWGRFRRLSQHLRLRTYPAIVESVTDYVPPVRRAAVEAEVQKSRAFSYYYHQARVI